MKLNFKSLTIILVGVWFVLGGSSVFAQQGQGTSTSGQAQNVFCNRLTELGSKVQNQIMNREQTLAQKQLEREQNAQTRRQERDEKLEQIRSEWEVKRAERYQVLEVSASTTAQKEAVNQFRLRIDAAIATRKSAIDAAQAKFRSELDTAFASRKTALQNAATTYKNAYNEAVAKAQADCASGLTSSQIRSTFQNTLKSMRNKFQADRTAIEKVTVKTITETRNEAVRKAIESFKTEFEAAKTQLRTAFGQTQ